MDGEQGQASLAALNLPPTLASRSGRDKDSVHLYFRLPEAVGLANASGKTLGAGIDGRGDGGLLSGRDRCTRPVAGTPGLT